MEKVKNMENMWRYKQGFIEYHGNGEWLGSDSDEKVIVRKSNMTEVKSALDVIFDKEKKVKKPKKSSKPKEDQVTTLAKRLDLFIR